MASGNSDKPTSQYIKDEADQLYKSAQKYLREAEIKRDGLKALSAQTTFNFGRVMDALASMCRNQEELLARVKKLESSPVDWKRERDALIARAKAAGVTIE